MTNRHSIGVLLMAGATFWSGCGGTEPVVATTLDYEATQWLVTGAVNADALAEGATLSLVLREGGFVTGALFIPASVTGSAELTADMAGNWTKRGDTVRFNQVSETFVSEVAWILTPEELAAADSVDGSFYDVILTRMFQ